jgi:WD40 repeat protein
MDLSPDGKKLVAGGLYFADANNNYVELYDLGNPGATPKIIKGFKQAAENITFTPDGKGFYARDNAGFSIKYSDMQTAKEVIASKEKLMAISMNTQGTKIAGAGDNGNVYVWDLKNNYEMVTYKMPDTRLTAVTFSPDGSQLVVGNERGRVWIYNNGILVRELTGHTSAIEEIKYNHAGNFMATASKDYSIRLWNTKRLTEAPTLLSEHDWVWSVVFSPDDEQLMAGIHSVQETVVGKVDQTIHAYPTKINTMADLLCGYTERNMNKEEWNYYVGEDLTYEKTCPNLPANNN